jgi:hypothetical protein
LQNADIAMYHAKFRGKNNYQLYAPDLQGMEQLSAERVESRVLEVVGASSKK